MRKWNEAFGDRTYQALREGIEAADDSHGKGEPACHLIDSRKLSSYPDGGDGWHYGFFPAGIQGAIQWADGVCAAVEKILQALGPPKPFVAQRPEAEHGIHMPPFWEPLR